MQRLNLTLTTVLVAFAVISCKAEQPQSPSIKPVPDEKPGSATIEVGKALPEWREGEMDIHFINTTMGECTFVIFPDGTQLLIDAASSCVATNSNSNTTNTGIRSRWDPTKTGTRGSQIISAYLRKCMAWTQNDKIDYAVFTHFHEDHIGGVTSAASSNSSTYTLNGATEILDNFKVGKLMDRGYPDYAYPFDMLNKASNKNTIRNYVNGVKWHVANSGLTAEIFKAGSASQIVPRTNKYNVEVRNIAVNGEIWTGSGETTKKTFPDASEIVVANPASIANSDKCPAENICSCVMKITYGTFNYFAGADLQFNGRSNYSWKDAELPCAKVAGNVELMKADHHGVSNTNDQPALKALNPQVIVVNSWVDCHPRTSVMKDMFTAVPDVGLYITNFWQGARPEGVDTQVSAEDAARVKGYDGNVVIRVSDGGKRYKVIVTSDSDGQMTVKSVSDTYLSR